MSTEIKVDNGKYTFIINDNGRVSCLRNGEQWIEEFKSGSKALIALIHRAADLEQELDSLSVELHGALAAQQRQMVKFDVCWMGGVCDERRVVGVEMPETPRVGEWIDLEGVDDEQFWQAFPDGEEVYNVDCLVVERVIHRAVPNQTMALIHAETGVGTLEVWVTAPGVQVCGRCGHEV
jgi:hypothetical protein